MEGKGKQLSNLYIQGEPNENTKSFVELRLTALVSLKNKKARSREIRKEAGKAGRGEDLGASQWG